jgi:two pore calcium channel protein
LVSIIGFVMIKSHFKKQSKGDRKSLKIMVVLASLASLDLIGLMTGIHLDPMAYLSEFTGWKTPWMAAFIRPYFMIVSVRVIREYWHRFLLIIKDTAPMVLFIIAFVFYFSWIGQRLFSGTPEGVKFFDTFGDSVYHMTVCLTTSNFPDVMLPAYQMSRWYSLFFLMYLNLGLFLMMNLLLAIFYSNFKLRLEEKIEGSAKRRHNFLHAKFIEFGGSKGYLTKMETFRMFLLIQSVCAMADIKDIPNLEML